MQAAPPTSGGPSWGADAVVGQATQQMLVQPFFATTLLIRLLFYLFYLLLACSHLGHEADAGPAESIHRPCACACTCTTASNLRSN